MQAPAYIGHDSLRYQLHPSHCYDAENDAKYSSSPVSEEIVGGLVDRRESRLLQPRSARMGSYINCHPATSRVQSFEGLKVRQAPESRPFVGDGCRAVPETACTLPVTCVE